MKIISIISTPVPLKNCVIADLTQQGIIHHPWLYALFVYPHSDAGLKRGEYLFPKGSSPYSIWKQITRGTGFYYRHFTIVPGWTFKQLRAELAKAEALRHLTAAFDDKQIMQRLGQPNLSPEGEFFPDTYNYTRGDVDLSGLLTCPALGQLGQRTRIALSGDQGVHHRSRCDAVQVRQHR